MDQDSVAIIGSGGIGGFVAGELAGAGRAVTLCVRTPFERLTVEDGGTTRDVDLRIVADPGKVTPVRWILLTTKAQDTGSAKPWIDALAAPGTSLVMVQNGIGHRERAEPIAGVARIVPAIIYCSVERVRPGHIVHHSNARMVVPEGEDGTAFAALFAGTAFQIEQSQDFTTSAWRKFLGNLVANAITALTLRRMGVFREPAVQALAREVLAEAVTVARAEGTGITQADADRIAESYANFQTSGGSSMLYDRLAARPLEYAALTGALVAAADRHGIPVPVHRTLLALLTAVSGHPLDGSA